LREENEMIAKLKGLSNSQHLPQGLLQQGKSKLAEEISKYEMARNIDKQNELIPSSKQANNKASTPAPPNPKFWQRPSQGPKRPIATKPSQGPKRPISTTPARGPKGSKLAPLVIDHLVHKLYSDIRKQNATLQWGFITYEGSNVLVLASSGNDGLKGLVNNFKPDARGFAYLRVKVGAESSLDKFVFIVWIGNKVSALAKGRVSTDKAFVREVIKDFTLELLCTDLSELAEDKLLEKVRRVGGHV